MNHIIEITKEGVFSLFELKGKNMMTSSDAKKLFDAFSTKDLVKPPSYVQINKYTKMLYYMKKEKRLLWEW